jgi:hypothetical protein
MTVFEIFCADGLAAEPSAKRGGFIFFRKFCAESPWHRAVGKDYFPFLKKPVPRAPGSARRQRLFFLFFKKKPVPRARGKGRWQRRFFIF